MISNIPTTVDATSHVELQFPVLGARIDRDHGYELAGAISKRMGEHPPEGVSIARISGMFSTRGHLALGQGSLMRMRMPVGLIGKMIGLAGATLELGGGSIVLGIPTIRSLAPAPRMMARLVTIKGFTQPEPFLEAVKRQLEGLGVAAEAGIPIARGGPHAGLPIRRVLRIKGRTIVGFSVVVDGLSDRDSIVLQAVGLGGRRHMGCGIFVPAPAAAEKAVPKGESESLVDQAASSRPMAAPTRLEREPREETPLLARVVPIAKKAGHGIDTLYAKSKPDDGSLQLTLLEHTRDVCECAEALFEATGEAQLRAMGLDGEKWLTRLKRDLRLAAVLHDLGKSASSFQAMVRNPEARITQPIRHEAVSYWIARKPAVREWLGKVVGDPEAIERLLWAVAGHHRKFPPGEPASMEPVTVHLAHRDFRETVDWGAEWLGVEAFPELEDDELDFVDLEGSPIEEIVEAGTDAREAFHSLAGNRPEEIRYLALLKACLIASDVAGSVRRVGGQSMAAWLTEAFKNVPTVEDLDGVVRKKLGDDGELKEFQKGVGEATNRVVLVKAGCGSGKTLAAYHWAARTAERLGRGLRVFFCYPTTGTASEGYRDYLMEAGLDTALVHSRAEVDMKLLGLGDDEPGEPSPKGEDIPGLAAVDQGNSLDLWSTPLVGCTVDAVLGLVQNNRRGVYLWPSIAGSAVVFDEIHAYDGPLFDALVRFLKEVRSVPCLLMTASLPEARRKRIEEALEENEQKLEEVPGPKDHEKIKRYRREESGSEWDRVQRVLGDGGKVLWVVNTVGEAIRRAEESRAQGVSALIYHSRFRYEDRVERHRDVIEAFGRSEAALAISTQVSEMSLDLSADLLVTEIAPIPSLIQRLGRLNRRAQRDDPWPFVAYRARSNGPYNEAELNEAEDWLNSLGREGLSQLDLVGAWKQKPEAARRAVDCAWLDGGFQTIPKPLRAGSPGMDVILREDVDRVKLRRVRPEEVRIPMLLPYGVNWRSWAEVAHCKIAEPEYIEYDPMRGATWKTI